MSREKIQIAQIKGLSSLQKEISFAITIAQIKHIRRCLKFYSYLHPLETEHSQELIENFERFGFKNSGRSSSQVKWYLAQAAK